MHTHIFTYQILAKINNIDFVTVYEPVIYLQIPQREFTYKLECSKIELDELTNELEINMKHYHSLINFIQYRSIAKKDAKLFIRGVPFKKQSFDLDKNDIKRLVYLNNVIDDETKDLDKKLIQKIKSYWNQHFYKLQNYPKALFYFNENFYFPLFKSKSKFVIPSTNNGPLIDFSPKEQELITVKRAMEMMSLISKINQSIAHLQGKFILDFVTLMDEYERLEQVNKGDDFDFMYSHIVNIEINDNIDISYNFLNKLERLFTLVNIKLQIYENRYGKYHFNDYMKQSVWYKNGKFIFLKDVEAKYIQKLQLTYFVNLNNLKLILNDKGIIQVQDLDYVFSHVHRSYE